MLYALVLLLVPFQRSVKTNPNFHTKDQMSTNTDNKNDEWSATANLYSDQAARLTELHGADLVALLKNEILQAKTILEVGCGTGAFARAYLQQFPKGVPNQTLILSDLSPAMLDKAKESIIPRNSTPQKQEVQTKLEFQQLDGTTLEGIQDHSIDLVVSLFGVFLIPDQESAQKAIARVLNQETGVFANGSWKFGITSTSPATLFGPSLQDAFQVPIQANNPDFNIDQQPIGRWSDPDRVRTILSQDYGLSRVETYSALHTTVWEFDPMWTMMVQNPVSALESKPKEDQDKAKTALMDFLTRAGASIDRPLVMSSASILAIGKKG